MHFLATERTKKKYHSSGTVRTSNRKTKNTTTVERFEHTIEKQKIPQQWNGSNIQ